MMRKTHRRANQVVSFFCENNHGCARFVLATEEEEGEREEN